MTKKSDDISLATALHVYVRKGRFLKALKMLVMQNRLAILERRKERFDRKYGRAHLRAMKMYKNIQADFPNS